MRSNPQSKMRTSRGPKILAMVAIVAAGGLVGSTMAGAIRLPSGSTDNNGSTDRLSADARQVDYRLEPLRLGCEVRQTDEQSGVTCRWSAPTSDRAAGVRLLRVQVGSSHGRQVVYRSSNLEVTEFVDVPVRPGSRYEYVVQAVSHSGRIVGSSRPVTVAVPPIEPPEIQQLRLNCALGAFDPPTDRVHIGCEWSLPHEGTARTLTLWRSVDGGGRQLVETFSYPFESAYRDVVPAGSHTVVYAVIATDGDDEIVARSRPELVVVRQTDIPPTDVTRTDVATTDVSTSDVVSSDVPLPDATTTDVAPSDVTTTDVAPSDVTTTDVAPSDSASTDSADVSDAVTTTTVDVSTTRPDVPQRDAPEADQPERDDTRRDNTRREGAG